MSPSTKSRFRQPDSLLKNQKAHNVAGGSHAHDAGSADAKDAESVHSGSTIEVGPEGLLRQAQDYREHLIELGGKPTRPIAEYSRQLEEKRILLMPRGPSSRLTADEAYYRHYCFMEMCFFNHELMAWQSFMKWFRRKWVQQNETDGGSLPPPPPVLEIDPLDLHTQYLGFMLLGRKEDEKEDYDRRCWNFRSYKEFLEHITAIEKQVAELREGQEPEDDACFQKRLGYCAKVLADWGLGSPSGFQEQLGIVTRELADIQAHESSTSPSWAPLGSFIQWAADSPGIQASGTKRKRVHEDEPVELESTRAELHDETAPASKRTKRGGSKAHSNHTPPRNGRGKTKAKTRNDDAEHRRPAEKADDDIKPGQKRRGRPPKRSQPAPAVGTATPGKTKANQKRRGGPQDQVQLSEQEVGIPAKVNGRQSVKKTAVAKVKNTKASSQSSPRRSSRIAAQVKKDRV